ncbi:hypothetical protein Dda_3816 [Drechslerella dactyloides]|uniref:Pleckstrin homology domain-containing protein n=1 Tax=Drechslerella dactyloides TaxID=74499 RepID=A0AAD6J0Y6_DREDA|nr:hypothetical protein Dda_3816 [Drechslerella dactyloides]
MDDHIRPRDSESEDGVHSDNFMPIQRMGSKSFRRHKSRSRSRTGSVSPQKMGRYTPPLTNGRTSPMKNHAKDIRADEPISILDPRRFTPTLHASLVAEILSLRRELDAKSGLIDSLETDLSIARAETENTATTVASARKEARDIREQLKLKENDEALEELYYERDQALETVAELRRQVERLTKSRRKTEDDMERNRQIFDRERSEWELNKRSLEHRVHIAEGRLKTLLQEIASANEANANSHDEVIEDNHLVRPESIVRPVSRNSRRSMSSGSEDSDMQRNRNRFSMISVEASQSALRLADELSFIHETSEASEAETEGSLYPESAQEMHHDAMPDPESEFEPMEPVDEEMVPSRPSSGELSPTKAVVRDDRSEITEITVMAADDEEELQDLRQENKRIMEMVEQLEECIRLEKQERENFRVVMASEVEEWKDKYQKQSQVYQLREYQEQQEREVLQQEHRDQLELLESIAADTQHQLELLASEKAELKRSMDISVKARHAEIDEENAPAVESVVKAIVDEVAETDEEGEEDHQDPRQDESEDPVLLEDEETDTDEDDEDDDVQLEALPPIVEEESILEMELMKLLETPRNDNGTFPEDVMIPQSPREISANQGRKRISLMGPVSPPLSPPSTATRRSSAIIYVSSEVQTADIVIAEPGVDAGCQTDKPPTPPQTPTFIIPSITIRPPSPATRFEPRKPTRDSSCQTFQPPHTQSSAMQTEAIKVDTRILLKNFGSPPWKDSAPPLPPPRVIPVSVPAPVETPARVSPSPAPSTASTILSSPPAPPVPPEKSTRRPVRILPIRLNSSPGPSPTTRELETIDSPPRSSPPQRSLPTVSPNGVYRPPRTTSLWKYNDIPSDEDDDDDIEEHEDEFKTALSAPKPPKPKEPFPQPANRDSVLLPKRHPSVKRNVVTAKPMLPARAWNHTVPGPSTRRILTGGPPYPVPLRHSSRKLPPSITSSRASSPSPMPGGIRRSRNSVRKSRSALGLKTEGSVRTRSPPPMSFSSLGLESPTEVPPLPRDAILPNSVSRSGLSNYSHSHRYQDSSVTGTASIDSSQQQPSVVDAIAQTMVGEFLYKYVRKRFGGPEGTAQGWEKDDGGSGARHRRWVWVAPYERAVMWSTRQPTSGLALMGKSGRKLLIQSVLDVKDDTIPPRGINLYNRSILILTPARALKFTAATQERHYIWLMALSFLAHSSQSPGNALTLPPALPFEYEQLTQRSDVGEGKGKEPSTAASFMSGGESEYYDTRPNFQNPFSANGSFANGSFTTSHSYAYSNGDESYAASRRTNRYGSIVSDDSAADYPVIRRHARKRSNTVYPGNARMPPPRNFTSPTFSGFSGTHRPSDSITSDFNCNIPMYNADKNGAPSYGGANSVRGDNASTTGSNFFDAIPTGTMRMEAFISSPPLNHEDDDFFPDLSKAFQGGRSSNRNSRIMGPRNGEDEESSYHRRGDFWLDCGKSSGSNHVKLIDELGVVDDVVDSLGGNVCDSLSDDVCCCCDQYKAVGVTLAVASGVFIGVSYVLKKKGLLQSNLKEGAKPGEGVGYLKNAWWWTGMILMIIGEVCNFCAYAFVDAILVTPLGALSVVITAILSSIFLKERLSFVGKAGCFVCVIGSIVIAINAPEQSAVSDIQDMKHFILAPGFLSYAGVVIAGCLFVIFWVAPRWGEKSMLVYLSVCSLIGGLSVVATQGLGAAVVAQAGGRPQFNNWFLYVLLVFVVVTLLTEIYYLNKALNIFNAALVTPTYYVIFTSATIVTSAVLFQGFKGTGAQIATVVMGFLEICTGVVLLQLSKSAKEVPDTAVFRGDLDQVKIVAEQEEPESEPKADAIRGTAAIIRRMSTIRKHAETREMQQIHEDQLRDYRDKDHLNPNVIVEWDGLRRRVSFANDKTAGGRPRRNTSASQHTRNAPTALSKLEEMEEGRASSDMMRLAALQSRSQGDLRNTEPVPLEQLALPDSVTQRKQKKVEPTSAESTPKKSITIVPSSPDHRSWFFSGRSRGNSAADPPAMSLDDEKHTDDGMLRPETSQTQKARRQFSFQGIFSRLGREHHHQPVQQDDGGESDGNEAPGPQGAAGATVTGDAPSAAFDDDRSDGESARYASYFDEKVRAKRSPEHSPVPSPPPPPPPEIPVSASNRTSTHSIPQLPREDEQREHGHGQS